MTEDDLRELEEAAYSARRRALYGDPGPIGFDTNRLRAERAEVAMMRAAMGDEEDD